MSEQQVPVFQIQRVYMKEASLEQPNSPAILLVQEQPSVDIQLGVGAEQVADGIYEVSVTATVQTKIQDKTVFLAEVKQAGIFEIRNLPDEQMDPIMGIACPQIVYPYLRANVADLIQRSGFPPVHLSEINFQAMYEQQQAQAAGPGAIAAGDVDMSRKSQIHDLCLPESRQRAGPAKAHPRVVPAGDNPRGHSQRAIRKGQEIRQATALRRVCRRHKKDTGDIKLRPFGQQPGNQDGPKAVSDKDRSGMMQDGPRHLGLPGFGARNRPVCLIDDQRCRVRRRPPVLPVRGRRSVKTGDDQRLGHAMFQPERVVRLH